MLRKLGMLVFVLAAVAPSGARAAIDPANCPNAANATSVIQGSVQDALGNPVTGVTAEVFAANSVTVQGTATVNGGFYRICSQHNTWDVHIKDTRLFPKFATVNRPYTTFTNLGDLDFTPASGFPLLYRTNLTITPNAVPNVAVPNPPVTVEWVVRTKMPFPTDSPANPTRQMRLTLGHGSGTVLMTPDGTEFGGPNSGGWNRWKYSETFAGIIADLRYFASAVGYENGIVVSQLDRQPYFFDTKRPEFGPQSGTFCGNNTAVTGFEPLQPTTNPQPLVTIGVCDPGAPNASGLNVFSPTGKICPTPAVTTSCTAITPVLLNLTLRWFPATPLPVGNYYFEFSIEDNAGNLLKNPSLFHLQITTVGGNTPTITPIQPNQTGTGSQLGIVVGCQCTTPPSIPQVAFKVSDVDGAYDIAPGALRVRIYYNDERTKLYDYDPNQPENAANGGEFKVTTDRDWNFIAKGFSLQGKQPGRYLVAVSVTDHGGNTAVFSWNFILVAAV